jgi:hypothetical protein
MEAIQAVIRQLTGSEAVEDPAPAVAALVRVRCVSLL